MWLGAITLLAACGTASLARADVAPVVNAAFGAAGLHVTDIVVARAPVSDAWPVTAVVSHDRIRLNVDVHDGRVSSVDIAQSKAVSDAQLQTVARYASNPAEDRAATRRRTAALVIVVGGAAMGLLLARRARLREEAGL